MKRIFIIGFRGSGFRSEPYKGESLLIRAGHVGIYFEGDEDVIFGFHPTEEACRAVGDDEAVKEWLKAHRPMDGAIFDDTAIFERAAELADSDALTDVWQMSLSVSDEVFDRIRTRTLQWYTEKTIFTYAFPQRDQPPPPDRDNCATFPRRLDIPLPEPTGQLARYIDAMQQQGTRWKPKRS
ncbi:MAG: hypothetical protein SF123_01480 [Chloroflexota bacterium]|nr:hypothetical protein [Chloroflexota bacterium]